MKKMKLLSTVGAAALALTFGVTGAVLTSTGAEAAKSGSAAAACNAANKGLYTYDGRVQAVGACRAARGDTSN